MCAIFGTIGKSNLNLLKEISQKQIFRGPDRQSFYVSPDNLVSMGNNRLSVIDQKNGNQPMYSNDKRYVVVFNGWNIFDFISRIFKNSCIQSILCWNKIYILFYFICLELIKVKSSLLWLHVNILFLLFVIVFQYYDINIIICFIKDLI